MDWGKVLIVAVAVVGLLQWLKGLLPGAPAWAWAAASAARCVAIAAATAYLPDWMLLGLVALAASQIGYEVIVQYIKRKIDTLA